MSVGDLFSQPQMSKMRRIKCPSEYSYLQDLTRWKKGLVFATKDSILNHKTRKEESADLIRTPRYNAARRP